MSGIYATEEDEMAKAEMDAKKAELMHQQQMPFGKGGESNGKKPGTRGKPPSGARFPKSKDNSVANVFCPTGEGGGIDPTCSPNEIKRTATLVRKEIRELRKMMKEEGIKVSSFMNRQPSIEAARANEKLFALKTELESLGIKSSKARTDTLPKFFESVGITKEDFLGYGPATKRVAVDKYNEQYKTKISVEDFTQLLTKNVFCPTGEGGGIDPTCSPGETNKSVEHSQLESVTSVYGWKSTKNEDGTFTLSNRKDVPAVTVEFKTKGRAKGSYVFLDQSGNKLMSGRGQLEKSVAKLLTQYYYASPLTTNAEKGVWRTIRGAKVFIEDGKITKGPKELVGKTRRVVTESDHHNAAILASQGVKSGLKPRVNQVEEFAPGRGLENDATYVSAPDANRGSFGDVRIHLDVPDDQLDVPLEQKQLGWDKENKISGLEQSLKSEHGGVIRGNVGRDHISHIEVNYSGKWQSMSIDEYLAKHHGLSSNVRELPTIEEYATRLEKHAKRLNLSKRNIDSTVSAYAKADLKSKVEFADELDAIE